MGTCKVLHLLSEHLYRNWHILNPGSEYLAHGGGDLAVVHLNGTMQCIGLPSVTLRICEQMSDYAPLIFSRDRCMTSAAEGKLDLLYGPNLLCKVRVH